MNYFKVIQFFWLHNLLICNIHLLCQGNIIESGTHEELLNKSDSKYTKLWKSQNKENSHDLSTSDEEHDYNLKV